MTTARINEVNLYYEVHGEGIPLLLIAGLASDSQSWRPIMEDLATHYRVIVFDNRGTGRTSPQESRTSIQGIADDCIGLAKLLGLESINLLGHSMGGFVALDCAIRHPEYVNTLILAGTSSSNSSRNDALFSDWASCFESGMDPTLWFKNLFYWIFTAKFFENAEALREATRFALEYPYPQNPKAFRNQVTAIAGFNCTESLSNMTAKTLVIAGREDMLFPVEVCSQLARAIPGAVLSIIDDAAHAMHVENPRAFASLIIDFPA